MKYLIRSIKYFIWFSVIFFIILCILVLTTDGMTFSKAFAPEVGLFKEGSFYKILAFFIAVAAIYPAMSFVKKEVFVDGSFKENETTIMRVFKSFEYEVESEDSEKINFRKAKAFTRFMRLYEDRISITKDDNPLILTGYRKDILRVASAIASATRNKETE